MAEKWTKKIQVNKIEEMLRPCHGVHTKRRPASLFVWHWTAYSQSRLHSGIDLDSPFRGIPQTNTLLPWCQREANGKYTTWLAVTKEATRWNRKNRYFQLENKLIHWTQSEKEGRVSSTKIETLRAFSSFSWWRTNQMRKEEYHLKNQAKLTSFPFPNGTNLDQQSKTWKVECFRVTQWTRRCFNGHLMSGGD